MMKKIKLIVTTCIFALFSGCIGIDYLDDPQTGMITITGLANNELFVNASVTLMATYKNPQGQNESANIVWSSSNTQVAIIDGNGQLTALKVGTATIAANANVNGNSAQASFVLTVTENTNISEIVVSAPKNAVLIGQNLNLQAKAITVGGQEINNITVTWQQSNATAANISSTGQLNGLVKGQTKVKAIYNGLESKDFLVSVVENNTQIAEIQIQLPTTGLRLNENMQLTALAKNIDGGTINGVNFNWVSSNTSILSINTNGVAMGLAEGTVQIHATSDGFESPMYEVQIANANTIARLAINAPQNTLTVGQTTQFTIQAFNMFDEEIPAQDINWVSSATNILSINASGLATANAQGTAMITATHGNITSNTFAIAVNAAQATQRTGTFVSLNGYSVNGMVSLIQPSGGGNLTLQFASNFQSSSGPGLYIYLSNQANSVAGGVEVSKLNSNSGMQTYQVPAGVNLNTYNYVFIYCKPFNVPFGRAQLN